MPSRWKVTATRTRSLRPTSSCLPGRVRATIRRFTWPTSKLSTHHGRWVEQQRSQRFVVERLLADLAERLAGAHHVHLDR